MNILSIDWDYFINATASERFSLFPDGGNENLEMGVLAFVWVSRYADAILSAEFSGKGRVISDIGVLDTELDALYSILGVHCSSGVDMAVSESHKDIVRFIDEFYERDGEPVNVFNIDFHHDSYDHNGKDIDCGNWVRRLKDAGKINAVTWVRRDDSEDGDAMEVFETLYSIADLHDSRLIQEDGIDAIFVCRSGAWSPLHLDDAFVKMLDSIQAEVCCGYNVISDVPLRWNDYIRDKIDGMVEGTREFHVLNRARKAEGES